MVRNIRGIMKEKEKKKEKQEQRETHIGRGIAGMVALIAILIGVVTMKNQTTLNQMKEQLRTLQTMAQPQRMSEGNRTSVETKSSSLVKDSTPQPSVTPANVSGGAVQVTPSQMPSQVPLPTQAAAPLQSPVAK